MLHRNLSVPSDWGTHSYYAKTKTRVVIHNDTLRNRAAGPLGSGPVSPDQRPRTRSPRGDGTGAATCPRGGDARDLQPWIRTTADGSGPSMCTVQTPVSPRLSHPLRDGPEPPRVPLPRARARVFRWKLAHPPTLNVVVEAWSAAAWHSDSFLSDHAVGRELPRRARITVRQVARYRGGQQSCRRRARASAITVTEQLGRIIKWR